MDRDIYYFKLGLESQRRRIEDNTNDKAIEVQWDWDWGLRYIIVPKTGGPGTLDQKTKAI